MSDPFDALPQRVLDGYDEMPRGERRLADVILEHPTAVLDHSATELAVMARVSKATAARFFRRLGYASFKAAKAEARTAGDGVAPSSAPGWPPAWWRTRSISADTSRARSRTSCGPSSSSTRTS